MTTVSNVGKSRVFVLCVDGLEYDFVRNRDFPSLKQKQFFKVPIPKRCMTVFEDGRVGPFTPVIWKTIFTGRIEQTEPTPKPRTPPREYENKLVNWLNRRKLINKVYVFLARKGIVKYGLPERLGFKTLDWLKREATFLSAYKKPIVIHDPLRGGVEWRALELTSGASFSEIKNSFMNVFGTEKQETLGRIKENWDLFVVYTRLLDVIGHLYWQLDKTVEKYYRLVENFAKEIQGTIQENTSMVILSDHGMKPLEGTKRQGGEHSHHAFASFNHQMDILQPLKLTDLHPIICAQARNNQEKM